MPEQDYLPKKDYLSENEGIGHERWYHKILNEKRARTAIETAAFFFMSMLVIYTTKSDRIKLDIKSHTRIEASGTAENTGLSINGIEVDYRQGNKHRGKQENNETLMLSIDDFVDNSSGIYNIRATRNYANSIKSVYFVFGSKDSANDGANDHRSSLAETLEFPNTLESTETKEITYSGLSLKMIQVNDADGVYSIEFRDAPKKSDSHEVKSK